VFHDARARGRQDEHCACRDVEKLQLVAARPADIQHRPTHSRRVDFGINCPGEKGANKRCDFLRGLAFLAQSFQETRLFIRRRFRCDERRDRVLHVCG
jgi:hypothetical protein